MMELLHKSSEGFLFRCACKRHFHIAFGTVMVVLTYQQMVSIHEEVESQIRLWEDRVHPGEKAFYFPTDSPNVNLLMNYRDMQSFYNLVSKGRLVLQAQSLIEDEDDMSAEPPFGE